VRDVGGDAQVTNAADFTLLGRVAGDLSLSGVRGKLVFQRDRVGGDVQMAAATATATSASSHDDAPASAASPDAGRAQSIRLAVLQSLEQGEITVEEATALLAHAR
jgi:hypothetical protein